MPQYNKHNLRVDPSVFQHPAEKAASDLLRKAGAFQKAMAFISENSLETVMYSYNRSTLAEITAEVSPTIDNMLSEAEEMFGVDCRMTIFMERRYEMTAMLSGIKKPYLVISSELLKQTDDETLWGLLASEVAGIKSGFNTIKFVEKMCAVPNSLISPVISAPLKLMFMNWHKYAEYSFDRANLLATGDLNVTMRGILLGETPQEALKEIDFTDPDNTYMRQCREFLSKKDKVMDKARDTKAILSSCLYYASRYVALFKFYQSDFFDIIEEYQVK